MDPTPTPAAPSDALPPAPPHAYGAETYAPFHLDPKELRTTTQIDALLADPEIGDYLRSRHGPRAWTGRRLAKALAGFAVSVALLALLCLAPGWRMFPRSVLPGPADTLKPARFAGTPSPALRDAVRAVNADIDAGNKWTPVFSKLSAIVQQDPPAADPAVRVWAATEALVALASKDIAPDAANDALADQAFALLAADAKSDAPISFRAYSAYVRILDAAPAPKETASERHAEILRTIEEARMQHPDEMDASRDMLALEAESHIAAFPGEYDQNERILDYHWRKAAHAIARLRRTDAGDDRARALDRRRWESVRAYFDFTLTLDLNRLGWREYIMLDGTRYDKNAVKDILKKL